MATVGEVGRQRGIYGPGGDPAARAAEAQLQNSMAALEAVLSGIDSGLSPEAILAVANRQIGAVNDDIMGAMRSMNVATHASQCLRSVMDAIQARLSDTRDTDPNHALLSLDDLAPGDRAPAQTYRQLLQSAGVDEALVAQAAPGGVVPRGGAEHFLEVLQNRAHAISDSSDSLSMQLQQAVSRRSQMMQLASNLLQSLHETARGIIQNTH